MRSGLGESLSQWDEKLPEELWAEEGYDQDGAKRVGRTFWSVHYSCCSCCWFPQGQLPTFWGCLSRTFLNGTSGLSLSTLYLLILTTDELFPNFPWLCTPPPPFWMSLNFADSLNWIVLMMLLNLVWRWPWSTLTMHNVLLCGINYWGQGLTDKYCGVQATKRANEEEGGGWDVSRWNCPLRVITRELTSTYKFFGERISLYFLWEARHHKFCEWFLGPMDLLKSCPNVCLCTLFWREVKALMLLVFFNGFITIASHIWITCVQACENVYISKKGLKGSFTFLLLRICIVYTWQILLMVCPR